MKDLYNQLRIKAHEVRSANERRLKSINAELAAEPGSKGLPVVRREFIALRLDNHPVVMTSIRHALQGMPRGRRR